MTHYTGMTYLWVCTPEFNFVLAPEEGPRLEKLLEVIPGNRFYHFKHAFDNSTVAIRLDSISAYHISTSESRENDRAYQSALEKEENTSW